MKIEILDEAEKDLIDGFAFYERQSRGRGDYFLDSIFSDVQSLHLYAGIHPLHLGYHRLLAKRFPFAIYYRKRGT
ncbi:MAG: type II toxin-antitoxin system RelE/ParE family toxin [Deltaproteobacteria bacterium]|nr:type II toxin-antitoxin system RelE/ParE family toxin [Deltaproteobacteria bacterium]